MVAGNKFLIRDINTSNIIETIIKEAPISRADISKKTNLTKATVSTIVQNLIDANIVDETISSEKTVGRKSFLLELLPQSGHCISLDVDLDIIKIMVSDLSGQKILFGKKKVNNSSSLASNIIPLIQEYNSKTEPSSFGLMGISVAMRFPCRENKEFQILKEEVASEFSVNVYVYDHSIFSVLGENAYSAKSDNIVFVNNLNFISMGFINKGNLMTSQNCGAYLLGRTVIESSASKTLDSLASLSSILEYTAIKKGHTVTLAMFFDFLKSNDPVAEKAASLFIKYMSIALNNIMIFYSPDVIVINCPLTSSDEIFLRLKNSLGKNKSILYRSVLNEDAALYGGSAYCIMKFLKIDTFKPAKCYFKNLTFI